MESHLAISVPKSAFSSPLYLSNQSALRSHPKKIQSWSVQTSQTFMRLMGSLSTHSFKHWLIVHLALGQALGIKQWVETDCLQGIYCLIGYFSKHWLLFATPWIVARQAPLSMGFFRQEHCYGFPCPPPEDLPNPGVKLASLMTPAMTGRFFTTSATREAQQVLPFHTGVKPGPPGWKPGILTARPCGRGLKNHIKYKVHEIPLIESDPLA